MQILIVSDLHLGNGQGYDIYAGGTALPQLLRRQQSQFQQVIFNGDTFDFLMNTAPLYLSVKQAVAQAEDIARARETAATMRALGEYLAAGNSAIIRQGNHDIELALPEVQAVFRKAMQQPAEVAARLVFQSGEEPMLLNVGGATVLLAHGEHNDPFNQIDYCRLPLPCGGKPELKGKFTFPVGSLLVKELLNPLKRDYCMRFADLLKPDFQGAVLTALAVDPSAVKLIFSRTSLKILWQCLRKLGDGATFDLAMQLEPDLGLAGRLDDAGLTENERLQLAVLLNSDALPYSIGHDVMDSLRRKLGQAGLKMYTRCHRAIAGATDASGYFSLEPEPSEWEEAHRLANKFGAKAVILGHTHAARWGQQKGLHFANTGTWIWLMRLPDESAPDEAWLEFLQKLQTDPGLSGPAAGLIERHLHTITLEPDPEGGANIAFHSVGTCGELTQLKRGKVAMGAFFSYGIHGRTGLPLLNPLSAAEITQIASGKPLSPDLQAELTPKRFLAHEHWFGVPFGVDPNDLSQAGWAVVFPTVPNGSPEATHQQAIYEALKPLLDLRQSQTSMHHSHFYREYRGKDGFPTGQDSKTSFFQHHRVSPGVPNPYQMPYYLLLVADPKAIPYSVQYQLDVQRAVGRIWFDTIKEYANYAQSVVAAETSEDRRPHSAAFFGVANPDDLATQMSTDHLVAPLATTFSEKLPNWRVMQCMAKDATKSRLLELLGGSATPSLLVTASHGLGFDLNDPNQLRNQGALLCQDWPGPKKWNGRGEIPKDYYVGMDDLGDGANLNGLIAFFFACYSAGCPRDDQFYRQAFRQPEQIAPYSFVASLPRRMLGHPRGGALAVIGHVDRAWSASFLLPGGPVHANLTEFESAILTLANGQTVGAALEYFNQRHAGLSCDLTERLQELDCGRQGAAIELEIARLWTSNNDARGYVIVGDPAVRLTPPKAPGTDGMAPQR
jgi:UDP-2,3-diacylglucosamine pyrophosphatase LpxH